MENLEPVKGISGTLASAVLGVNPWKSPLSAYNAIFGLEEEEEREAMRWGTKLEPLIAREYQERTGAILWPHTDFGLDYRHPLRHAEIPWWTGTPDRLVIEDSKYLIDPELYYADGEKARAAMEEVLTDPAFWAQVEKGWEAKTAGPRMARLWGEEDSDEIPEVYLIQSSWYLCLTRSYNPKITSWDVSVLLGGQQFRTYTVEFNPKLAEAMAARASDFWHNHILTRTPPKPRADPAWQAFFRRFYPVETQPLTEATLEEAAKFFELYEAKKNLDIWQNQYESLANELKLMLGDRAGIQGGEFGDWKLTWKKIKDIQKIDWKAVVDELCQRLPDLAETIREAVKAHTTIVPGPRRFLPSWPKEPQPKQKKEAA
uniref:YqaJ viral recombinase domain-containing protein n=1 Tax=Desulfobacca acetoxidans TaxID=60893 RepID=A0A7C3ZAM2_9BACT